MIEISVSLSLSLSLSLSARETIDESSQEVKIRFVDEIFRIETRDLSAVNGDSPDDVESEKSQFS